MADVKTPSEKTAAPRKKKIRRVVVRGFVHIYAARNNTIVSITDENHAVLTWSSAGASGFEGARKSTPYAAQTAAKNAAEKAKEFGLEKVDVQVKGIGPGREQAIRGLLVAGLDVLSIRDTTSVPHGGCRPRKARRV